MPSVPMEMPSLTPIVLKRKPVSPACPTPVDRIEYRTEVVNNQVD